MGIGARGVKGALKAWVGRRAKRRVALFALVGVGILLTQACSGDGGSAETDRAAMVALFHSTNGTIAHDVLGVAWLHIPSDQWETLFQHDDTPLDRWETFLQNIDVLTEHWEGYGFIKTDGKGRITALDVGEPGWGPRLAGEIPPELGNLSKLEVLDLYGGLTGEIPPELGNLSRLKVLKLNGWLTGEIPRGS